MPPSPSKFQGNPSGRGGSTAVDVSDADGKLCYSVPKRHISHYGVDGGGGRLVACRNYTAAIEQQLGGSNRAAGSDRSGSTQSTNSLSQHSNQSKNSHNGFGASYQQNSNANCPMGHRCKFVHIDVPLSSLRSEAIHTHFVWREPSLVSYEMLPPVIAKEQPTVSEQEIADTVLTVFGPNNREPSEKIRADRVLMTRGARFAYEAAIGCPRTDDAPPCCHCAHYYFNQVCNRGPNCAFVHVVSINPTLSETHIKTSNFHRRISLLGEENLYSNGDGVPAATTPNASSRPSPQVSRQPSAQPQQREEGDDKQITGNKAPGQARSGRSASFPLSNADDSKQGRNHHRDASSGFLNPSVPSTPRAQAQIPHLPPTALGTTPQDPLPTEEPRLSVPPPPSSHVSLQRQASNSPPPPPPSATQQMRGRCGSGMSAIGGRNVANTNNNSFNNVPTVASTPSASRRVSIGYSQSGEAPSDLPSSSQVGISPSKPTAGAAINRPNVSIGNKRADDVPPPPPPSQLVRQPSQTGISAGNNNQQQQQQSSVPQQRFDQQHVAPQQGDNSVQQVYYDDGFNANYQDYMNVAPYSSATHTNSNYYNNNNSSHYGSQQGAGHHYYNGEYHQGGPGYYQPPASAGGAIPQQQQHQTYYNGNAYQQPQPLSPLGQRLQSPTYKPEMLGDHYQNKPGMPPPPSYECSFGHLSLGSRPSSPANPPQYPSYTSFGASAGQNQSGAVNNRPPPPPMPQPQSQQQQYSYPNSPPYPGGARNNISAIYINGNNNTSTNSSAPPAQQPLGSNSASAPSLPSPNQQLLKTSYANINGLSSNRSEDHPSPNGALKATLSDGNTLHQPLSNVDNSSIPSRTGSTVLSATDSAAAIQNASVTDAKSAVRYVHNPYSGSGGNSPAARSRTSSMTGPQPHLKMPPPQVYVTDSQVW